LLSSLLGRARAHTACGIEADAWLQTLFERALDACALQHYAEVRHSLLSAAQRPGSGAAKSGSEARADAVCRRLHPGWARSGTDERLETRPVFLSPTGCCAIRRRL